MVKAAAAVAASSATVAFAALMKCQDCGNVQRLDAYTVGSSCPLPPIPEIELYIPSQI